MQFKSQEIKQARPTLHTHTNTAHHQSTEIFLEHIGEDREFDRGSRF